MAVTTTSVDGSESVKFSSLSFFIRLNIRSDGVLWGFGYRQQYQPESPLPIIYYLPAIYLDPDASRTLFHSLFRCISSLGCVLYLICWPSV